MTKKEKSTNESQKSPPRSSGLRAMYCGYSANDGKEAVIAEYEALQSEIRLRIGHQQKAIAWVIPIVVAFVGAMFTLTTQKDSPALAVTLLTAPTADALKLCAMLCSGLTIISQMVMLYSVYQLFQIFRMSNYIPRLNDRLVSILRKPNGTLLFGWNLESKGLADVKLGPTDTESRLARFTLAVTPYTQQVALFGIAGLGFLGTSVSVFYLILNHRLSCDAVVLWLFFLCILLGGILVINILYFGLHRWINRSAVLGVGLNRGPNTHAT